MKFNNINILYLKGEEYDIDFNRSCLYMAHLFLRLLGKYDVGTRHIVMIDLVPPSLKEINGISLKRNEFVEQLQVLQYYRDFDIDAFHDYTLEEKNLCLWNILFEVMKRAAIEYGWDQEHLQITYDKGLFIGLKNEFYFKDYKTSPDRKFKAIVRVDFQMKICLVYADFYTHDGTFIGSDLFFDWEPAKAYYNLAAFNNASWNKDHQFILNLKGGRIYAAMMPGYK